MEDAFPALGGETTEQYEARLAATLRDRLARHGPEALAILRGIATDTRAKPTERAEARSLVLTVTLARLEELAAGLDDLKKEPDQ